MDSRELRPPGWVDGLYWLICFALVWFVLSGGGGYVAGGVFALIATVLMQRLGMTPSVLRLRHVPRFLGFYFRALFVAGWDVARRAFYPRMPLAPGWEQYPLRESSLPVRQMLSAVVCLLPGTLASHMEGDTLHLHVLDRGQPWHPTVQRLEELLMRMLGEGDS